MAVASRQALHLLLKLPFAALLVLLGVLTDLPQAAAHAVLLDRFPAENEVLKVAPGEVRLSFNEPVTPVLVRVLDQSGKPVAGPGAVSARDTSMHIRLPDSLPSGIYIVSYRVISADSHPVGGSYVFAVGEIDAGRLGGLAAPVPDRVAWGVITVALRTIFYAAWLVAVGGALFGLLVDRRIPPPAADRREILAACAAAALALLALLGVKGGEAAQAPLSDIGDPAIWMLGFGSTLGVSAAIIITGLAVLALAMLAGRRSTTAAATAIGCVVAAIGFAATGHVAIATPRWLTGPALVLHILCAAYWAGALLPLYRRLLAEPPTATAAIVARFSRIAVAAVAVLSAAGLAIAIVQVGAPEALADTAYGQALVAKLILVAVLLLLAALNKWRLTPRLANGDPAAPRLLRRTIAAELALVVGILLATAMLGQTPPPRALGAAGIEHHHPETRTPGFTVAIPSGDRMAVLDISPARAGANRLSVTLTNSDGAPLTALGATIRLANPGLGIEASEHIAVRRAPGHYEATAQLPVAGTWTVEIEVLVSDFERMDVQTAAPIR